MLSMIRNIFRGNPTKDFSFIDAPLTFDVDAKSLNGAKLGGPLSTLSALGPASHFAWEPDEWLALDYRSVGLQIEVCEQTLDQFSFFFKTGEPLAKGFDAAKCRLLFSDGQHLDCDQETRPESIEQYLGEPDDRTPLVGKPTLEYVGRGGVNILFEVDPDSMTLCRLQLNDTNG